MENEQISAEKGRIKETSNLRNELHQLTGPAMGHQETIENTVPHKKVPRIVYPQLVLKELDEFYEKILKDTPNELEIKKAYKNYKLLKKIIKRIKEDCRQQSTFDGLSGSKTLKDLGITPDYLNTHDPCSEVMGFAINKTLYENRFGSLLSLVDPIDEIRSSSDEKLKEEKTALKKYLKRQKKYIALSSYKDNVRRYVEIRKEIHIRNKISQELQQKLGASEKDLHLDRLSIEIPGITMQKPKQKSTWRSILNIFTKRKPSINEEKSSITGSVEIIYPTAQSKKPIKSILKIPNKKYDWPKNEERGSNCISHNQRNY